MKKPPFWGHSPPISTKIFFDVIKILIALRFLRGFALSAAALRAPCAWFRFLVPLAAALRSFLDLLCHLLPLRSSDLPGGAGVPLAHSPFVNLGVDFLGGRFYPY